MIRSVPAVMMTAPAFGQGQSMVTAALVRLNHNACRTVRVFKYGPDFSYFQSALEFIAAVFNGEPLPFHNHKDKNHE